MIATKRVKSANRCTFYKTADTKHHVCPCVYATMYCKCRQLSPLVRPKIKHNTWQMFEFSFVSLWSFRCVVIHRGVWRRTICHSTTNPVNKILSCHSQRAHVFFFFFLSSLATSQQAALLKAKHQSTLVAGGMLRTFLFLTLHYYAHRRRLLQVNLKINQF